MERRHYLPAVVLAASVLFASSATLAETGETLFKSTCARCHGEDGSARTAAAQKMKIANLRSDYVQNQSDDQLFKSIGQGQNHKQYSHGFLLRGMTEPQVRSIIKHVRTFKTEKATAQPHRKSEQR